MARKSRSALTLNALGDRIAGPGRAWRNRLWARRARLGGRPEVAASLPEAVLLGDAERGFGLVAGRWQALGHSVDVGPGSIWEAALPDPRLEAERQACLWLDDLAALGNRASRLRAQAWVQDWIRRFGSGKGPGWQPETAGRRVKRWTTHAALLSQGLDRVAADRFWRALAAQQRYLNRSWRQAPGGLPRLRALAGLVWSGRTLPHAGHAQAIADLAGLAETLIDPEGATPSRAPSDLAEMVVLLVWTARMLEDGGDRTPAPLLTAIARAVPALRPLRLGNGQLARFHGGDAGFPDAIDQALAELRLGTQQKPRLPMGYCRLAGGRLALVMDAAVPPTGDASTTACASALAFEMSVGRQPLVVNAGPGRAFGRDWARLCRQTAAHSTVEIDDRSSARIEARGLAARTYGARLVDGPTLVSVRQAQDATGMWLLATQDGYVVSHGLLHERRLFVDARGTEARGEEILSVTDARARAQFDRVARERSVAMASRFHIHPAVDLDFDRARQLVLLRLPSGEMWGFRAAGGWLDVEESVYFDPDAPAPTPGKQVVVRSEVVEYLGQITWSFSRLSDPLPAREPADG